MINEYSWLPTGAPLTRALNPAGSVAHQTTSTCCFAIQFSIFFDGTRNHMKEDAPSGSHSNIARLFDVCRNKTAQGQFRLYVQGVGTPFPEIGEHEPHEDGAKKGKNGDLRMRYASLFMANEIARLLRGDVLVENTAPEITRALKDEANIRIWRRQLEHMLANPKPAAPQISAITLDLFGFSRGATAARAFLNHLVEWAGDGLPQVCGIPLRVRFMGLFDTVASVEIADSMPRPGDGHLDWAKPKYMVVPAFVEQCVHMVAGHEARNSFPLTSISASREQAPRRLEIIYPGVHADVGGGYGTASQGKGTHKGSQGIQQQQGDLLSQIPLNDMYMRARAAGVPLLERDDVGYGQVSDFFSISGALQRAYDAYQRSVEQHGPGGPLLHLLHVHYLSYLGWRRHVLPRTTFIAQPFMTHCKQTRIQDHINLDQANVELLVYLENFRNPSSRFRISRNKALLVMEHLTREHACMRMYDLYWEGAPQPGAAMRTMFEQYVHDSRAGFVLTDPQCERDYNVMRNRLETKDAAYRAEMRRYEEILVPEHQRRLAEHAALDEASPIKPTDPLSSADRQALALYRKGIKPIFTDATPASSMDGRLDEIDGIAQISRREPRWSYLRRRQVFRPHLISSGHARIGVKNVGHSKRLRYEDGLT